MEAKRQKFRSVTRLLTPTLFFVLTMNLIYSFKVDQIYI